MTLRADDRTFLVVRFTSGEPRLFLLRRPYVLLLLSLLAPAGCSRTPAPAPDALLLTIDTLRGDRWGCLGDPLARTPHLDRLARGGTLAFEGRASAPITAPSHTSIMTGLPPAVHGVRDNGIFRLDPEAGTTLAERFRANGWSTAAFVSAFPLLAGFGLDRGFEHYDSTLGPRDDSLGGMRQRTAGQTLDRLEWWFGGPKAPPPSEESPLFLWVHFFDPHADYTAPAPWPAVHPDDPYRAEIAYTDAQTGRLLRVLARERTRDLRVIVTSDHGEGLYDHGESTHGALVHASTIRVPIVAHAGDHAPSLLKSPVSIERVPATLLSLAGLEPDLNPGGAPPLAAPPRAVHAETLYSWFNFGWAGLRSREEDGWRLIAGPVDGLYRMDEDPGELRNLAADRPEIVAAMKEALLDEWSHREEQAFPAAVHELSAEDVAALQALGYVAGGAGDDLGELQRAFESDVDPHGRLATVDRINHALSLMRVGRPGQAVEVLAEVVEEDPSNRFALENLGRALRDARRLAEARDVYYRAFALGRNPELAYLDLTEIEIALGDRDAAEQLLTQALTMNPRSVEARTALAQLLIDEDRLEEAVAMLEEALRIRPRAPKPRLMIAQLYEKLGRPDEAAPHWRRLVELDPNGPFGRMARARLES